MSQSFLEELKAERATPPTPIRLLTREPNDQFTHETFKEPETTPPYAILSHSWSLRPEDEVAISDLPSLDESKQKPGFSKLCFLASKAEADGLKHFWMDTCCIDRTNEAELSEAINAMFTWYRRAAKCYVYLSDVSTSEVVDGDTGALRNALKASRWFTRGWTLSELLAPACVEFFSAEGNRIGDKMSLLPDIVEVTGIDEAAITGAKKLDEFEEGTRLSWAAKRSTAQEEDQAYSLLGIFGISMSISYGEGKDRAMARLKQEIKKRIRTNLREGDHSFLKGATGSGKTYAFYISRGLHFVLDRSESCFFCGGKGHYETECQTSEEELKKYRTEAGLCFQCGSVGHFKDFCPWAVEKEAAL